VTEDHDKDRAIDREVSIGEAVQTLLREEVRHKRILEAQAKARAENNNGRGAPAREVTAVQYEQRGRPRSRSPRRNNSRQQQQRNDSARSISAQRGRNDCRSITSARNQSRLAELKKTTRCLN
jgi:hypothetical protein